MEHNGPLPVMATGFEFSRLLGHRTHPSVLKGYHPYWRGPADDLEERVDGGEPNRKSMAPSAAVGISSRPVLSTESVASDCRQKQVPLQPIIEDRERYHFH
jgi:hypothetical protein